MLHRLEIANFYSIRDPQIIDLRAADNVPEEPGRLAPLWPGAGDRAPKVVALFGANASGKSNVLKALSFLAYFAKDSFQASPDSWLPFDRFSSAATRDQPTRLAAYFSGPADLTRLEEDDAPQCRYVYEVVLGGPSGQPQKVLSESLKYWPSAEGRQTRLFERDEEGAVNAGKSFELGGFRQALNKVLRPNASVISTLAQLKHPLATALWHSAASVISNILFEKNEVENQALARYYAAHPQALELLNRDLQRIGLGVRSVKLSQGTNGPLFLFEHEGLAHALPAELESHGTRLFVGLFPILAQALDIGGVAVVDEMDMAIHPLVLPEIMRWFHDPQRNPHNAQLWMTCQNASLLEELTKEEILFCDKDAKGRTTVYGLADVQAVRRGDNYYKKYLGGVYGAIPRLG